MTVGCIAVLYKYRLDPNPTLAMKKDPMTVHCIAVLNKYRPDPNPALAMKKVCYLVGVLSPLIRPHDCMV